MKDQDKEVMKGSPPPKKFENPSPLLAHSTEDRKHSKAAFREKVEENGAQDFFMDEKAALRR